MSDSRVGNAAPKVRRFLRHDVEGILANAVGGPARLRVILLLACVLGLNSADFATVGAVAGELERSLHIDNTQVGLLVTVSTAVGAVATLPVGMLVDRMHRTRLLAGSIVVWCAAMAVSGASTSYVMLLITQLALGAVIATAGPAVASLTGDFFSPSERGRIYGFILSGELLGTGFGFLVCGDVAGALSWRWSYWALALPGIALAVAVWRLLPEPDRGGLSQLPPGATEIVGEDDVEDGAASGAGGDGDPEAGQPDGTGGRQGNGQQGNGQQGSGRTGRDEQLPPVAGGEVENKVAQAQISPRKRLVLHEDPTLRPLTWAVRYVLSIPTNRILIVASGLGYFFLTGLQTFAVVYMKGRFHLGQGTASSLLVLLGCGAIVGVLIAGRLADRLIGRGHIPARITVAAVAFLISAAIFLPGVLVPSLAVAAPLFFFAAAALGGTNPPLDAARLDIVHSRLWGRAESVRSVLRSAFAAVAPLVFGYVSELFGGNATNFGEPAAKAVSGSPGLDRTFLVMLVALAVAGLITLRARHTYARDVATAVASERATRSEEPEYEPTS